MARIFTKKFLMDDLDLPHNDEIVVVDTVLYSTRWAIHRKIIFKHEGKFWQTKYSVGATEYQDAETPWGNVEEVECTEVHEVEKMLKVWEEVS